MAQDFLTEERLKGYAVSGDTVTFLFDAELADVDPNRVVVTGVFRGWSQDMENVSWALTKTADVWMLDVANPSNSVIPTNSSFKFRIDAGIWIEPPFDAPNISGGNLVFMMGILPPVLYAEIESEKTIRALFTGIERPAEPASFRLTDANGNEIPIDRVEIGSEGEVIVIPAIDLDRTRAHFLEVPESGLRSFCHFDGWFRNLYSDKELGANVSDDGTSTAFRIFSPRAEAVNLYLYTKEDIGEAHTTIAMVADTNRVWEAFVEGDLHGTYYDFTVHGPVEAGNNFFEARPVHISDPYARVNVDALGRSRVWHATTPATALADGIPPMADVVAYEMHVQDFTDLLPIDAADRGTIPGVTIPGLTNHRGEAIGFDHLLNLGINTVHLMPIQEFLHYPDDIWQEAFSDDPFMQKMGIADENYQWGYRITHAFAVETRYRRKGTERGAERDQFRDLVQAFHDHGIAVVIDVVFNHTGENMEGQELLLHFDVLDRPYYYRTRLGNDDQVIHIGKYGNETKSEDRPMMRRWIIDQALHFINEFGVDGFRIDLAGQTDKQTLLAFRDAVGHDKIVYGEPWIASNDPRYEANPDWDWYKIDAPITFFQDDTRNALQGPPSNPTSKETDRGWSGGNFVLRPEVKLALTNGFPEEIDPDRGIGYTDVHDNWTLADRFATHDWDGRLGVDEAPFRLATTLLLTSLGPILLNGGSEMMRSKGLAPLIELNKQHAMASTSIHGKRDTYNLRAPNRFLWDDVGRPAGENGVHNDYAAMIAYWRGLIRFRLSDAGSVFRVGKQPPADYFRWIEPDDKSLLGYFVNDSVLVLANAGSHEATFRSVRLPPGTWKLIGNGVAVDHVNGVSGHDERLAGDKTRNVTVSAASAMIWIRE